ncbi:MAG: cytochrome b/b6 domain-containing protein [Planctomycetota bacterium]|nr:cytochrome b/b6 domain-containing protein [Planctomycetota bacterium]
MALKRKMSKSHAKARVETLKARGRAPTKPIDTGPRMFVSSTIERMRTWLFVALFLFICVLEIGLQWREVTVAPEQIGGYRTLYTIHFYATFVFLATLVIFALPRLPFALVWHNYDFEYIRKFGGFGRKYSPVPPAGRYNALQKLYTLAILLIGGLYGITGIAIHSVRILDAQMIRLSFNIHLAAFIVMVFISALYVYFMYIATPGRFSILTKGFLKVKFLQTHHSVWFEKLKERPLTSEEEHRRVMETLHHKDIARVMKKKSGAGEVVDMEVVEEGGGEEVAVEASREEAVVPEEEVSVESEAEESEIEAEVEGSESEEGETAEAEEEEQENLEETEQEKTAEGGEKQEEAKEKGEG